MKSKDYKLFDNYKDKIVKDIKRSEKLRIEITKEKDAKKKLDKSLLLISLLVGDSAFYNNNKI